MKDRTDNFIEQKGRFNFKSKKLILEQENLS